MLKLRVITASLTRGRGKSVWVTKSPWLGDESFSFTRGVQSREALEDSLALAESKVLSCQRGVIQCFKPHRDGVVWWEDLERHARDV